MIRHPKKPTRQERLTRQTRLRLNRVLHGISDFVRNLGLLYFGAAFVEPLINGNSAMTANQAFSAAATGLALLATSLTLLWMQKE